jgi:hypothetical protein
MTTLAIGNRTLETPVLIPSVSSFETQLKPADALRLQYTLREPISLVSAYDVWHDRANLVQLSKEFRKHGILLLDSGGYESSRIAKYSRGPQQRHWKFSQYAEIAAEEIYDFIFSFDYFPEQNESPADFAERIVVQFRQHAEFMDITKLIPVIHVQTIDASSRFPDVGITDVFGSVASQIDTRFIAVPERELGSGISARAQLTRKIVMSIRAGSKEECLLHVLGCGNLLSFSLLAVAGVHMCDGLEWCRTFAAENFHLHHFQQKDIFADPGYHVGNPVAEFVIGEAHLDYPTAVAVRNLLSVQEFTRNLHSRLSTSSVHDFIGEHFGTIAGQAARTLGA